MGHSVLLEHMHKEMVLGSTHPPTYLSKSLTGPGPQSLRTPQPSLSRTGRMGPRQVLRAKLGTLGETPVFKSV